MVKKVASNSIPLVLLLASMTCLSFENDYLDALALLKC